MTKEQFSALSFGTVDAENDDLLIEAFVKTESFHNILNGPAWLVLGPKGSGKSAIYKYLNSTRDHSTFVRTLLFKEYPWAAHEALGTSDTYAYTASWDYFNVLQLMQLVVEDQSAATDADLYKTIETFFRTNWLTLSPAPEIITRKQKVVFAPEAGGFKLFNVDSNEIGLSDLVKTLSFVLKDLTVRLLEALNRDHRYWIIFDELDHGFDAGESRYNAMLIGLLQSVRKMNEYARDVGRSVKFLVLLRSDIFNVLEFGDKNKIRMSNSITLRWSDKEDSPESLKRLMERRIIASLGEQFPESWRSDPWSLVFDETQEMPGRRSKFSFMCDLTRLRPRDAIAYCNIALEKARARNCPPYRITNDDMNAAREEYSTYFKSEVEDETRRHKFPYDEALALLEAHRIMSFTRDDLARTFERQRKVLSRLATYGLEDILKSLWELGVIAQQTPGRAYEFVFEKPTATFSRIAERFRVHYGLKEALQLIQERS